MISDSTFQKLNVLLNLVDYSTNIRSIIIKEKYRDFNLRPQMHLILCGISGTTKSTVITQIGRKKKIMPLTSITAASLVGSIDKETKQVLSGFAWKRRNSIILLDEISFNLLSPKDKNVLDVLLQLMENQEYSKGISMFSSPFQEKDDDLFFIAEKGQIDVKTRIAFIIGTMHDLFKTQSLQIIALVSRSIPFSLEMSSDEVKSIADGKRIYIDLKFTPKRDVIISVKDYERIRAFADNHDCHKDIYLRTIGDMCRAFAVMGEHDDSIYNMIIALKNEFTWLKK